MNFSKFIALSLQSNQVHFIYYIDKSFNNHRNKTSNIALKLVLSGHFGVLVVEGINIYILRLKRVIWHLNVAYENVVL